MNPQRNPTPSPKPLSSGTSRRDGDAERHAREDLVEKAGRKE